MSQPNYGGDINASYGGVDFSDSPFTGGNVGWTSEKNGMAAAVEIVLILLLVVVIVHLAMGKAVPAVLTIATVAAGVVYLGYEVVAWRSMRKVV